MSLMTWITCEEASLIARSSKRPRFALCVWLAILELAEGGSEWQGSRIELAKVASALLPPDRFPERRATRIARLSTAIEHAASSPVGENVSRTLTELRRAGLIEIAYVDHFGTIFPRPARSRRLSIMLRRSGEIEEV